MRVIKSDELPMDEASLKAAYPSKEDQLWIYNGLDCAITTEVHEKVSPKLDGNAQLVYAFTRGMMAPALQMMLRGVLIDQAKRQELIIAFERDLTRLQLILDRLTSEGFGLTLNPNSTPQLKHFFYDVLGLPPVMVYDKLTRERKPSVNREALEKLKAYFYALPFVNLILGARDVGKKLSVLKSGVDKDGRMRCSYNIVGTAFGRWSASKNVWGGGTNLQNVTDAMREMFIPDPGMKMGNVDLEQAESRGVAYLSGDENYIKACESGDLHTTVCMLVWAEKQWPGTLKAAKAMAEEPYYRHFSFRDMGKRGGHATNYFAQAHTIAKHLKLAIEIAQEFQNKYYGAFPGIRTWQLGQATKIAAKRHLITPFGRKIWFFGRPDDNETIRSAIAAEPQSMIGDVINIGLYRVWKNLDPRLVQILLQIHDAITYQFDPRFEAEAHEAVLDAIKMDILINGRTLVIPGEASSGWNWRKQSKKKDPKTGEVVIINPYGLAKWNKNEPDKRIAPERKAPLALLDRLLCNVN